MEIDFHAKNQVNICKRLGKMSGKLKLTEGRTDRRTDRWTDRRTECKPKIPFDFAGRGLTSDPRGETKFDPRVIIWALLVEAH